MCLPRVDAWGNALPPLPDRIRPAAVVRAAPENKTTPTLDTATLKALEARVAALETALAEMRALVSVTKASNGNTVTQLGNAVTQRADRTGNALTPAEKQRRYRERKKATANA